MKYDVQETNSVLADLYHAFLQHLVSHQCEMQDWSKPYFLKVPDSGYEGKIMLYGQEANGWEEDQEEYVNAVTKMATFTDRNTRFVRMISKVWNYGGLINNINKFASKGDKSIKCDCQYDQFDFRGKRKTIFQHEIDLLAPRKILLVCGPNRAGQI